MANETNYVGENSLLYIWNKIKALISGKVDAESGKGLSTNDYTTDEKNKLADIEEGANNYTLPTASRSTKGGIKRSDGTLELAGTIQPEGINCYGGIVCGQTLTAAGATFTANVEILDGFSAEGDVNFAGASVTAQTLNTTANNTSVATTAFVHNVVDGALSGITGISLETVTSLPSSGTTGVIYLLSNGGSSPNQYDEYIWTGSAFEKIGTTAVDLTGYWAKADLTEMDNATIDSICV